MGKVTKLNPTKPKDPYERTKEPRPADKEKSDPDSKVDQVDLNDVIANGNKRPAHPVVETSKKKIDKNKKDKK